MPTRSARSAPKDTATRTEAENPVPRRWGLLGETSVSVSSPTAGGRSSLTKRLRSFEYYLGARVEGWPGADWRRPEGAAVDGEWVWTPSPPATIEHLRSFRDLRVAVDARESKPEFFLAFDQAVKGLIAFVGSLHHAGVGAGLIQPDGVVFDYSRPAQVFLLDAGFTFGGIVPPNLQIGEDVALWDHELPWNRQAQLVIDRNKHPDLLLYEVGPENGFDPPRDLRSLSRLLAWVLEPAKEDRPEAGVWRVISRVLDRDETITTAYELEALLEANPPSEALDPAFGSSAAKTGQGATGSWHWLFAAVAGIAIALGAVVVVTRLPGWLNRPSAAITDFEEAIARNDLDSALAALERMADPHAIDRAPAHRVEQARHQSLGLLEKIAADRLARLRGMTPPDQQKAAEGLTGSFHRLWKAGGRTDPTEGEYPEVLRVLRDYAITMQNRDSGSRSGK